MQPSKSVSKKQRKRGKGQARLIHVCRTQDNRHEETLKGASPKPPPRLNPGRLVRRLASYPVGLNPRRLVVGPNRGKEKGKKDGGRKTF
jgi:hypothetical protein